MRVRLWAALAAVLALSAPLQARAQDARSQGESRAAFAVFRDVCIAGNGDADYAIGKLRAQGWVAIPDELGASMKQELGPDAVILSTRTCAPAGLFGRFLGNFLGARPAVYELTAASPDGFSRPAPSLPSWDEPAAEPDHRCFGWRTLLQSLEASRRGLRPGRESCAPGLGRRCSVLNREGLVRVDRQSPRNDVAAGWRCGSRLQAHAAA